MHAILTDPAPIASVTPIRPVVEPVELPYRKHETRPVQRDDLREFLIEQQLSDLADEQSSPETFLTTWCPTRAETIRPLLEQVLAASAVRWDARYATLGERTVAEVDYDDALYELRAALYSPLTAGGAR